MTAQDIVSPDGVSIAPCYTAVNPPGDAPCSECGRSVRRSNLRSPGSGRPPRYTRDRLEMILLRVRAGVPLALAARCEGVPPHALRAWMQRPEIDREIASAQLTALEPAITALRGRAMFDATAAAALARLVLGEEVSR